MTNIERKALELVNDVMAERNGNITNYFDAMTALCRAIEQHEAFRQEVSDAVQTWVDGGIDRPAWIWFRKNLERFIIAKPDPLVAAMAECGVDPFESWADQLRAALAKRGGRIVFDDM